MKRILIFMLAIPIGLEAQINSHDLFQKFMQAQVKVNHFSGVVLVMKKNSVLLKRAYGSADMEWNVPNTIDSKFRIYSITKQFTAACILQLEERGKLSLNDKLSKYFPDYPKGDSVTIHMLLSHTSGIPDYVSLHEFEHISKQAITKDSIISLFKNRPYDFSPGTNYNYTNSDYFLLGCIIEMVSGLSYGDYLSQNIFKSAGMSNSGLDKVDVLLSKRAKGYQRLDNKIQNAPYFNVELLFSSGGLYSTAEDLYKWDKALYGSSIISASSKAKMFKAYKENYGYGVWMDTLQSHFRIGHNGVYYGFRATLLRFPSDSSCVVVLTNNESQSENIATGLSAILFHIPVEFPYVHKEARIDPVYLNKYIGKYTLVDGEGFLFEIVKVGDKLYYRREGEQDYELRPESKTKFFFADGTNIQFEFFLDKNEKVSMSYLIGEGIRSKMKKVNQK
jgi:CubicO group peptidase (beta-lactamase class C family)